jgi:hypothetical protein
MYHINYALHLMSPSTILWRIGRPLTLAVDFTAEQLHGSRLSMGLHVVSVDPLSGFLFTPRYDTVGL